MKHGILSMRSFGSCPAGDVALVTITDGCGMYAQILTLGAVLYRLAAADRNGEGVDVVLGYNSPEEYFESDTRMGAVVGRVAGRIAGASFDLGGRHYELAANAGKDHLHGGPDGFSQRIWTPIVFDNMAIFRLMSPDGDQGYPGNVQAEVVYSFEKPGELAIRYKAYGDRDTLISLTNHSYFNLGGAACADIGSHRLSIAADAWLKTDADLIPTGEILPVEGSPFDYRQESCLGEKAAAIGGLDHCFVLKPEAEVKASLYCPETGIRMDVLTDRPAVQVYTGGHLSGETGKYGRCLVPFSSICLETQAYPDAVHHDNFPTCVVRAGEVYETWTVFRFSAE